MREFVRPDKVQDAVMTGCMIVFASLVVCGFIIAIMVGSAIHAWRVIFGG